MFVEKWECLNRLMKKKGNLFGVFFVVVLGIGDVVMKKVNNTGTIFN